MARIVLDKKGFTIIELLISLTLVAIVFAGLVQSSILVMNTNLNNALRDEAVNIAEDGMNTVRNMPFSTLVTATTTTTIARNFRAITGFPFTRQTTISAIDMNNKQVTVRVTWNRKGVTYNHNITTVVRDPNS